MRTGHRLLTLTCSKGSKLLQPTYRFDSSNGSSSSYAPLEAFFLNGDSGQLSVLNSYLKWLLLLLFYGLFWFSFASCIFMWSTNDVYVICLPRQAYAQVKNQTTFLWIMVNHRKFNIYTPMRLEAWHLINKRRDIFAESNCICSKLVWIFLFTCIDYFSFTYCNSEAENRRNLHAKTWWIMQLQTR